MADWKLLGEVPDSEDEDGFDSQELAANIDSTTVPLGQLLEANDNDIWEFLGSQDASKATHTVPSPNGSLSSSPLSSAQSVDGLPDLDGMFLDGSETSNTQEALDGNSSKQNGSRIYIELANRAPTTFEDLSRDDTPNEALDEDVALPSQDLGHLENTHDLQREAVRLDRSLRPRKPIQEHPYLLENAQYSSLIRQHGMRPVQVAIARVRAVREENVQDGDFQDDSQGNSLPDLNHSSQLLSGNGVDGSGDLGIFNFASSSPPKTSPWIAHGRSSNHGSSQDDTDNTSVPDQDLPALHELLSKSQRKVSPSTKRPNTMLASSARKRRRHDIVDSDPMDVDISGRIAYVPASNRLAAGPLPPIPRLQMNVRRSVDIPPTKTVLTIDNSSSSDNEGNEGNEGNEEEEMQECQGNIFDEPVKEKLDYRRRIRGVLPASWLRLDQKASRDTAQKVVHGRQRNSTLEKEARRGLAQTRTISNAATSTDPTWFFDESEDDASLTRPATTDDTHLTQSRIILIPDETPMQPNDDLSDEGSVLEHDTIDSMFSGSRRRHASRDASRPPKTGNISKRPTSSKHRQTKITTSVNASKSTSSGQPKPWRSHGQNSDRPSGGRPASRPAPKPLSVLDVIERDAPRFLRIAARTARTRVNQGRSSPMKKMIRLASRVDHVDAAVSLNQWKSGSIPQRREVSEARKEKRKQVLRKSSAERAGNQPTAGRNKHNQTKIPTNKLRKFVKKTSSGGSARYLPSGNPPSVLTPASMASIKNNETLPPVLESTQSIGQSARSPAETLRPSRPALLEAEDFGKVAPLVFHRRKKFLDRIYRKNNRESSVDTSDARSEATIDRLFTANQSRSDQGDAVTEIPLEKQPKRSIRPKKARKPVRIDVDAPQFSHAADPLPNSYTINLEPEQPQISNEEAKLAGLGPYGTQYTTHFEIFPLSPGVYFHQSTLLGSGVIEDCQKCAKRRMLLSLRPRVTFQFGTYSCRWSDWNSQTSSELGIVLDLVAEELEKPGGISIPEESTVLEASRFISKYATSALTFADESAIKPFIERVLDVVGNFHCRLSGFVTRESMSDRASQTATRVYDNLLILLLVTLMICTDDDTLMTEKFRVEDLLRSLAAESVSNLLLIGIDRVQESYRRLQESGAREQGLRADQPVIHSWALLMQILEASHIPRGSFWDLLKQTAANNDQISIPDAQRYERIWKTMFAVLPMSEFNSSGILIPGKRHEATSDGWTIVQQLLRQVFTIYRRNTRQPPSFNNYCRALISRCHYLVQQWGWRRSAGVVGTIFDFFGSQNLEHLRNEEANASPKFLEHLAGQPSLVVDTGDNCFHVFLKLLALSIQKLRAAGANKDIRNLVARTIPNHNRQHLKEQTVHERDLAALRNHHDLLATLFWAAPPDLRPSPTLIERLVAPETSHKEASLINIRCWNQLSRFIVAKGEAATAFKPFHLWRKDFFQKMIQQFDSAAADIQQQLLALPSEVRHTISMDVISSMVSMNKGAVGDVLHASITASLDVMKHAADLEAATFCLNTLQLQHVYKQFSIYPPELNWNVLRAAISTLDLFVGYIAEFKENEESQQSESQILNSAQADDALLLLDHEISKHYFSMVRCILSNSPSNHGLGAPENFGGAEQGVTVAIRLATGLINGGLIRLHHLFKRGKYGLFDGPIHKLDFTHRQYLVLVVVTLLRAGFDDFADVEFTLCELWLLLLVRPSGYLKYENQLAEVLRQRGEYFLPSTDTGLTNSSTYESNGTLFEFAISTMRSSIRDAGPNLKRILTAEHSKALKLVMEQMKEDLKATSSQPVTHVAYVAFARRIISLIRTHGSEICTLDSFYYQISKDYSPSREDPQLQVAAMVSYGLRLREGDTKVVQQVFFFLFNNFKMALISDSLKEEKKTLCKGMSQDRGITQFIIGKMIPAVIEATAWKEMAYPLLDLYTGAIRSRLKQSTTTYNLSEADLPGVMAVVQATLNKVEGWAAEQELITAARLHALQSIFAVFNLLWPSLYEYSLNEDVSSGPWCDITELIRKLSQYVISSRDALGQEGFWSPQMQFGEIFAAVPAESAPNRSMADGDVRGFADNIKQDIDRNWYELDGRISIEMPGKPRARDTSQGVLQPRWDAAALVDGARAQLTEWLRWKKKLDEEDHSVVGEWPEAMIF
ncbi:Methyl methanesulfonate-sensitivity protein 22 [Akanthomyces lecanii RCEF 1005]|uniref:Methyl methanesulfonate-sensitivity protein 22 n=1 Tax=Akanthomyces lecanii RCEF 1005 TaxID=1081108 RepID=A0A162KKG8_CORDF|nr:Methyl methanesulfonate-sensitivity protein 22 [Akanthomyces lecanii RCEF 1005]